MEKPKPDSIIGNMDFHMLHLPYSIPTQFSMANWDKWAFNNGIRHFYRIHYFLREVLAQHE